MKIDTLKKLIQEELKIVLENESNDWETVYTWAKLFSTDNRNFLSKNNITSGVWLKKAIESGKITPQDIDNVTRESDGTKFSELPMLKTLMGINEESATGAIGVGAGPIQTPYAFAKKGQKTNKATQTAMKQGFKKASGMPKNSKMFDYKELWKGKKSSMNEEEKVKRKILPNKQKGIADKIEIASILNKIIKDVYEESNLNNAKQLFYNLMDTSNINDSVKKRMISKVQAINNKPALNSYLTNSLLDYEGLKVKESKLLSSVKNIIKEELLNETSYNKFKNEVKYRTKNEMLHKSIREVKRKLEEVERLVEYTTRIKQELSENEEGISYWKRSLKAINEISEVSNKISNRIKSIYQ